MLLELRQICYGHRETGRSPIYVMFNNVYMREDALRFAGLSE